MAVATATARTTMTPTAAIMAVGATVISWDRIATATVIEALTGMTVAGLTEIAMEVSVEAAWDPMRSDRRRLRTGCRQFLRERAVAGGTAAVDGVADIIANHPRRRRIWLSGIAI